MPSRRSFLATTAAALTTTALPSQTPASSTLPPPILALSDRRADAVPIASAEREQRLIRARELMHDHHLDAIAVTTGASLRYFTGFSWGQSERLFAWLLPRTGAPLIICPAFEEGRVRERLAPAARSTRILAWNEDDDPYALVVRGLRDAGLATGRLGIDERTQFVFADSIAHAAPALTLTSATPVTAGCRSRKSSAELALLQLANNITLAVYEAAFRSLTPGMTNQHVSGLIAAAYERTGFSGDASCEVGPASALPHGSLQPQIIREGQVILIDDGCSVEGYQSDISRSFVLGRATDRQKRVFDIVHRAQAAALAAARPGSPCHAPDTAARTLIEQASFGPGYKFFLHRVGHGIGMEGHEWPYLVRGNQTTLAPGMCFSDEPGIYLTGEFGIRLEDCMHITPDGARLFTPQSPSLEHPFAT